MKRKTAIFSLLCLTIFLVGCTVTVFAPRETTIKAVNELVEINVTVDGETKKVNGIDLTDVTIGDVSFSSINYGEKTNEKTTHLDGVVNVHVGSAYAVFNALGSEVSVPLPILYDLGMTVKKEQTNTFYFDTETYNKLTKKQVK
jgi:hypothetical protein